MVVLFSLYILSSLYSFFLLPNLFEKKSVFVPSFCPHLLLLTCIVCLSLTSVFLDSKIVKSKQINDTLISFTHLFLKVLLLHLIIYVFMYFFIQALTHSLTRQSFVCSFNHSFTHSTINSSIYLFVYSFIKSLIHSFMHSLIHSFI